MNYLDKYRLAQKLVTYTDQAHEAADAADQGGDELGVARAMGRVQAVEWIVQELEMTGVYQASLAGRL